MAGSKSISLSQSVPRGSTVYADKYMLDSIMRNLIGNAIKFTYTGGEIKLSALRENDQRTRISVSDNGMGMSEKILDNLFKININVSRPGTANEPSTGLGLLLCKEFVDKHKGTIWAESTEGKGSTFHFVI